VHATLAASETTPSAQSAAPPQLENAEPGAGVAMSAVMSPSVPDVAQVEPQLNPAGKLETVPLPEPMVETETV
jgi:hypothetical protein